LNALGDKIFGDIWNLITAANFATATSVITAANFDRDGLIDLGQTLTETKKAPRTGRSVWMNPTYYGSLLKSLNSAEFPGQSDMKAEGMVPRVNKFDVYESDQCDANGEISQHSHSIAARSCSQVAALTPRASSKTAANSLTSKSQVSVCLSNGAAGMTKTLAS
jgi:hypothetical protein